jgi:hypothetical protein
MISGQELSKRPSFSTQPSTVSQGRDLDYSQPWVRQYLEVISQTAHPDVQLASPHTQVAFLHKRGEGKDWYLLSNDSAETVTDEVTFSASGTPALWDPETGDVREAPVFRQESARTTVPLKLLPYSALAVVFEGQRPVNAKPHLTRADAEVVGSEVTAKGLKVTMETEAQGTVNLTAVQGDRTVTRTLTQAESLTPIALEGSWLFHLEGEDQLAVSRPLGSWTDTWPNFSGTGWYEREVVVPSDWLGTKRKIYLDLGAVQHMASVRVNGKEAGTRLWSPYRLDITALLKAGANRLEIGVTNTLANRYGQGRPGLREKPASGLLGPVRLTPAKVLESELTWSQR